MKVSSSGFNDCDLDWFKTKGACKFNGSTNYFANEKQSGEMVEAATTVDNPAAGPDSTSCDPLITETTMPPMTPERIPEYKGAPGASAMPKQSGRATKKTERPAGKSYFIQMSR
jgi:hypothetical protein